MDNQLRDFLKVLHGIDRSRRDTEVFADFCDLTVAHLAMRAPDAMKDHYAHYKARIAELEGRYDRAAIDAFAELCGRVTMAVGQGGRDFLGEVAGEIGALSARTGQFFTPYPISRLHAEIVLTDIDALIEQNGYITLSEPAVGAGCMVIAAADCLADRGYDPSKHMWVHAVELSRNTANMAALQIAIRGVAGRITHGNSLSLDVWGEFLTPATLNFFEAHGEDALRRVMGLRTAATVQAAAE